MLRPHFLFNALNAIARLIDMGRNAEAGRAVLALGTLLRQDYYPPAAVTTLEEEIQVVESYVFLQQIRFGDKVQAQVEVAPAVRSVVVPSGVLLPLVENAFTHGIEPKMGPARLTVRAEIEAGIVRITVADDGKGIQPCALTAFQTWQQVEQTASGSSGGGHLQRVQCLLRSRFGRQVQFTLRRGKTGGTVACITFPLRREEGEL